MQFGIKTDGFRPYRLPSVADLAFYPMLSPARRQTSTTAESMSPFPLRVLSGSGVHLEYYHFMDGRPEEDDLVAKR